MRALRLPRIRLLAGLAAHTSAHTSQGRSDIRGYLRMLLGDGLGRPTAALHLVWGRVVPDIPAFCRELVAALAEG